MPDRVHATNDLENASDTVRARDTPLPPDSRRAVLALQRTAGNHAVARWLGARPLARQPQPPAPPAAGPVGRSRAEAIAALDLTVQRVQQAVAERDNTGRVPQAMTATLCRFFPGFTDDLLDDILARLQPMSGWIPGIDVRRVTPPATNPPHPDATLIEGVRAKLDPQIPAFTMLRSVVDRVFAPQTMVPGNDFIVLLPQWDADADLQATRLLHEYFHFSFVGMGHGATGPLNNAHAWQGFVSVVGELETGEHLDLFPPCR